jgi:hypothetical protein
MVIKRILVALLIIPLGLYLMWTALHGLGTGEVPELSKHGHAIVLKTLEPTRFWITVTGWAVLGSLLIAAGVRAVKQSLAG